MGESRGRRQEGTCLESWPGVPVQAGRELHLLLREGCLGVAETEVVEEDGAGGR